MSKSEDDNPESEPKSITVAHDAQGRPIKIPLHKGKIGDGGSVIVLAGAITGSGNFSANGGDGPRPGRGGNVVVMTDDLDGYTGRMSADGGRYVRDEDLSPAPAWESEVASRERTVFVVHGRDEALRAEFFMFLRSVGLSPLEWNQAKALTGKGSPHIGEIIDSGMQASGAIVVLMSGDDLASLRKELQSESEPPEQPAPQPRPNVIFEAGLAWGRYREKAVLVTVGALRGFSDIDGVHVVRLDNSPGRRTEVVQCLQTCGCAVDTSGTDWLTVGNLVPSV